MNLDDIRTCRFCKEQDENLIKYNTRHYAHAACGLKVQGAAFLDNLSDWQCTRFPYFPAKAAGVLTVLEKRIERYEATERRSA